MVMPVIDVVMLRNFSSRVIGGLGLFFDGQHCQTERINDVLRYILQIDRDLDKKESEQLSEKLRLSALVEHIGFEPMASTLPV